MATVTRVAFFDDGVFSHSYPSPVFGPLKDHWLQDGWIVSKECPSTVYVTTVDRDGRQRVWKGKSGDNFSFRECNLEGQGSGRADAGRD